MSLKLVCVFAVIVCLVTQATSSAIPMWEFLSRPEKASQLYHIYKKQVSNFCQTSTSPDCSKTYMITGIQNIANMDDQEMDEMDPYQRGAKSLIWSKLSGNAASSRVAHEPDNSFHTNDADHQEERNEKNLVEKEFYNVDSDASGPHLTGPVVVRVLPDGRPVPGDEHTPAPKDDDLEDIKFERVPFFNKPERKQYKQPFLRTFIYSRKPVKYSKNYISGNPSDYRIHARIFSENGLYYGSNEIPRYRRFYTTFDHRF